MADILIWHGESTLSEHAGRIYRELSHRYANHHVWPPRCLVEDHDSDSTAAHRSDLATADVLVVLFGPMGTADDSGERWFDHTEDSFRRALSSALNIRLSIVPVLLAGGELPRQSALPDDLKPLSRLLPVAIADDRWASGSVRLMDRIGAILAESEMMTTATMNIPSPPEPPAPMPEPEPRSAGGFKEACIRWLKRLGRRLSVSEKKKASRHPVERGGIEDNQDISGPQDVWLGTSAPAALRPGDECTVRFAAYLGEEETEVEEMFRRLSPRSASYMGIKRCRWQPGTEVTVCLSGRWLEVEEFQQAFVWNGERVILDFDVGVSPEAPHGVTILKFDIFIEGIRVAKLRMDLQISAAISQEQQNMVKTQPVRSVFASYCSHDRQRVIDRLASVRISAGFDVFMDCLSIQPGEAWKPRIALEIRSRDQFLLFWSRHAAKSEWVVWEWKTALLEKGKQDMQIHPLESNVQPPDELSDLHFGDVLMAIRYAETGRAERQE